ncbi:DIP1984 family protein [Paraglaciecola arctica]|uniref:DIP1984 family protein n=1 Tax=Paraglaciecola arctica TaxID=1128911 RepID=UPI001C065BAA|nr:DIP1984 family protein [Paraglaciecola arctica]MBU3006014.1 DIP1984 family protein [Paraglaciecola arctica]
MKLAEALSIRADLQRKAIQLKERILRNAKIQVGEKPAEDPNELLLDLGKVSKELVILVNKINRTNTTIKFDSENTLADILSERDQLASLRDLHRELAKQATVTQDRYKKLEIKFVPAVDVRSIQKMADGFSKQFRELDVKIQALNWTEDLLD